MDQIACPVCRQAVELKPKEAAMYEGFESLGPCCSTACLLRRIRSEPIPLKKEPSVAWRMNGWERSVRDWLDQQLKPPEKTMFSRWKLRLPDGKTYSPDFLVEPYNSMVEVKGQWGMRCGTAEKFSQVLAAFPSHTFILVTESMVKRIRREK